MTAPDVGFVLRNEFRVRTRRNDSYSKRAFARDLGVSPSQLVGLLKGDVGLSKTSAERVARALGYEGQLKNVFLSLAAVKASKSVEAKRAAIRRLKIQRAALKQTTLPIQSFADVSEWYHFALLELLSLKDSKASTAWIATRLGISEPTAEEALKNLTTLGMIEADRGRLRARDAHSKVGNEIPSAKIRAFHKQILKKAFAAVEEQKTSERDLSSSLIAIKMSDYERARTKIDHFITEFCDEFGAAGDDRDELYCLSTQFFRITQELKKNS